MNEKSWPLAKEVKKLTRAHYKLAAAQADLKHRLDTIQAAASAAALVAAVKDIAKAIREGVGVLSADEINRLLIQLRELDDIAKPK
jgi:hypothetical protein